MEQLCQKTCQTATCADTQVSQHNPDSCSVFCATLNAITAFADPALHSLKTQGRAMTLTVSSLRRLAESSFGLRRGVILRASRDSQSSPSNHLCFLMSLARPFNMPSRRAGLRSKSRPIRSCYRDSRRDYHHSLLQYPACVLEHAFYTKQQEQAPCDCTTGQSTCVLLHELMLSDEI